MSSLSDDIRIAARVLRRRPSYTVLAVATLALGIGAATTMYSVVDGVLLAPLPYPEASRLTVVYRTFPSWRDREGLSARWDRIWFSYPAFRDWNARQSSFDAVGAWSTTSRTLSGTDGAEQVSVVRATATLARTLGIQPIAGRTFIPGEDASPVARVAMVSYEAWTTRFGSTNVIGQSVRLDGTSYEIVGILPPRVDLGNRGKPAPFWIPAGGEPSDARSGSTDYLAIGRLRDHVGSARATDETRALLAESSPPERVGARLVAWQDEVTRSSRRPLLLLLGASIILLALACVNVATLALGESSARVSEFATRAALGAGRSRIVRQVIIEALIVAAGGVVCGALAARSGVQVLTAMAPAGIPRLTNVHVDLRVLGVACAASAATALLFALAPAISLAGVRPASLSGSSSRSTTARHDQRALQLLLAGQVALSCVLLVSAALLGRSLRELSAVDPGFAAQRLVLVGLGTTGGSVAANPERMTSFYADVAERIATVPGVERAVVGSAAPFSGGGSSSSFRVDVGTGVTDAVVDARRSHVLPGFLETLGVRLLAGRVIDDGDRPGGPLVAVVNETMARRFWPNTTAIGKRVAVGDDWLTIVGVVSDVKHATLGDTTRATVYLPARQQATPYLTILVRTTIGAAALAGSIRRAVAAVDPSVPVTRVDDLPKLVSTSFAAERFRAVLIGLFAVLAGVLATIGVYGVTARAARRQRREIGIRMALGSPTHRVVGLFVGRAGGAVTLGVIVGIAGALASSRLLAPYLFATRPTEPVVYAGAIAAVGLAALIAAWLPARHASRANPASVLRDA